MIDVNALLAGLTLSDEDRGAITELFGRNPDAVTKIQSQISSYVDSEIGSARTDLDTKRQELEAEWTALRTYRGNDDDAIAAAEKRIETLQSKVAVAEARLESTARRAGLDPEPLLKDIREAAPVTRQPDTHSVDSTMNSDQVLAQAGRFAWNAVEFNAGLNDVDREHQRLFGKPLDSFAGFTKDLAEEARRTNNRNLTPMEYAEKKYGFPAKRSELQEQQVQARIKQASDEAVEKFKSEQSLRITQTGTPDKTYEPSPIFGALKPEQTSPIQVNGISDTVSAAILDFRKRTHAA